MLTNGVPLKVVSEILAPDLGSTFVTQLGHMAKTGLPHIGHVRSCLADRPPSRLPTNPQR